MSITKAEPLVSICCITYNHETFVGKTLNGFISQITDFPFEILIHDDCSTDHTKDILARFAQRYAGPIQILYEEENQFSKGVNIAFDILLPLVRGKYVAICEGDDWWTDPNKLQTQISFMEAHPECSLTVHNGIRQNCATGEQTIINPFAQEGFLSEDEMYFSFMNNPPTASFVVRTAALTCFPEYLRRAPVVDDVLRLYCYEQGPVYYFDKVMCFRSFQHRGSWNVMLQEDLRLFENYTVRLLEFYEQHDQYTNFRHHEVIQKVRRKIGNRFMHLAGPHNNREVIAKVKQLSGSTVEISI